MPRRLKIGPRQCSLLTVALVSVFLAVFVAVDVVVWSNINLPILYAIPVLVAALVASPRFVIIVGAEAVAVDALDVAVSHGSPPWPLTLAALVVVCCFAVQLSLQRQQNAARTREAEDAHREAREAHHQLRQFLSMISHELRQPLGVMVIALEILGEETRHPSPAERRAQQMLDRSVRNMERLVTDLHDAARIGADRFIVRREPMDLAAVCRQVIQEHQGSAIHRLIVDVPSQLEGSWDRQRVQQLLSNLVSNAMKYSPEGGDVRVEARRVDRLAVIRIADQGIGIDPKEIPSLFQPFTRLDSGAKAEGSGLGLYIARAIAEAHGGTIEVESAPNQGSTFIVSLPLGESDRSLIPTPASPTRS